MGTWHLYKCHPWVRCSVHFTLLLLVLCIFSSPCLIHCLSPLPMWDPRVLISKPLSIVFIVAQQFSIPGPRVKTWWARIVVLTNVLSPPLTACPICMVDTVFLFPQWDAVTRVNQTCLENVWEYELVWIVCYKVCGSSVLIFLKSQCSTQ